VPFRQNPHLLLSRFKDIGDALFNQFYTNDIAREN
jgi:hypothetical protein